MTRRVRLPRPSRRAGRRIGLPVLAALVVAAALGLVSVAHSAPAIRTRSQFVAGTPEGSTPVRLDTTLYLPASTPAPAVLLAHGFGSSKNSTAGTARTLAEHGFVVLTYTARGFGRSGGLIHFDAPDYEVHDAQLLVDYLAAQPQVARSGGRPQIAVAGSSYGGALALLLAGTDPRIGAVAAGITWNDLVQALFPNDAGPAPGVFKRLWASWLYQSALAADPADPSCGRFAPDVCQAYQYAASTGQANGPLLTMLRAASPAGVLRHISAPTLLFQGEQDSLFGLDQADANARGIAANGTPVRVKWGVGGHDAPGVGGAATTSAMIAWFRAVFAGKVHGGQPFDVDEPNPSNPGAAPQVLQVTGYPGVDGPPAPTVTVPLSGRAQQILAPAGGTPAAVTAVPRLGGLLPRGVSGFGGLSAVPGQFAAFLSPPLAHRTLIAGSATVQVTITSSVSGTATLFAALRDVAGGSPAGAVLPNGLVAPLSVPGLQAGVPRTVSVHLPSIVYSVPGGDRLALTLSTTDLTYQLPTDPRTYTVALPAGARVDVPTLHGTVRKPGTPLAWLIVGIAVALLVGAAVAGVLARRRRRLRADRALAEVPVVVSDLVKEYGDGYRAVDGVGFRVEPGQVVGLLGPNGAGKTTVLRTLVGLITPTSGTVRVFGVPVVPGAAVLSRVGALIEGPGFLPHLSGLENLRSYWAASGRPESESGMELALAIAGLQDSIHRRVKSYSHGMRQRLGVAQAMLGLPEVLVLDEPTNGLDPPQIAEMREVMRAYAATGRTVIVSSHLLAEVEQTCSHVVVLHRGRLVASGSVLEVAGAGRVQLQVDNPARAEQVLAASGIGVRSVPARRALEDVFLDLIGDDR